MNDSRRTGFAATAVFVVCVALTAGAVVFTLLARGADAPADVRLGVLDTFGQTALLAFPLVGAIIVRRRPANAIGWLFCGLGLLWSVYVLTDAWAVYSLYSRPEVLPAGRWVAWLANGKGSLAVFATASLTPLLFPTGHLPSRRWQVVAWLTGVALAGQLLVSALAPHELLDYPSVDNPVGVEAGAAINVLDVVSTFAGLAAIVAGCAAAIIRFRRAKVVERQQLEWFVWAAALVVVAFALVFVLDAFNVPTVIGGILLVAAILALPIATGIAILRYQLFDIDKLVNRTLVYGIATSTLAALYVLAVVVLQPLVQRVTRGSDIVVAGTTLLVAALFRPVRVGAQRLVEQRFYRRPYDAQRVVDVFSYRLREEIDLDTVSAEFVAVVQATLQPEHVSLWLAPPPDLNT